MTGRFTKVLGILTSQGPREFAFFAVILLIMAVAMYFAVIQATKADLTTTHRFNRAELIDVFRTHPNWLPSDSAGIIVCPPKGVMDCDICDSVKSQWDSSWVKSIRADLIRDRDRRFRKIAVHVRALNFTSDQSPLLQCQLIRPWTDDTINNASTNLDLIPVSGPKKLTKFDQNSQHAQLLDSIYVPRTAGQVVEVQCLSGGVISSSSLFAVSEAANQHLRADVVSKTRDWSATRIWISAVGAIASLSEKGVSVDTAAAQWENSLKASTGEKNSTDIVKSSATSWVKIGPLDTHQLKKHLLDLLEKVADAKPKSFLHTQLVVVVDGRLLLEFPSALIDEIRDSIAERLGKRPVEHTNQIVHLIFVPSITPRMTISMDSASRICQRLSYPQPRKPFDRISEGNKNQVKETANLQVKQFLFDQLLDIQGTCVLAGYPWFSADLQFSPFALSDTALRWGFKALQPDETAIVSPVVAEDPTTGITFLRAGATTRIHVSTTKNLNRKRLFVLGVYKNGESCSDTCSNNEHFHLWFSLCHDSVTLSGSKPTEHHWWQLFDSSEFWVTGQESEHDASGPLVFDIATGAWQSSPINDAADLFTWRWRLAPNVWTLAARRLSPEARLRRSPDVDHVFGVISILRCQRPNPVVMWLITLTTLVTAILSLLHYWRKALIYKLGENIDLKIAEARKSPAKSRFLASIDRIPFFKPKSPETRRVKLLWDSESKPWPRVGRIVLFFFIPALLAFAHEYLLPEAIFSEITILVMAVLLILSFFFFYWIIAARGWKVRPLSDEETKWLDDQNALSKVGSLRTDGDSSHTTPDHEFDVWDVTLRYRQSLAMRLASVVMLLMAFLLLAYCWADWSWLWEPEYGAHFMGFLVLLTLQAYLFRIGE